MPLAIPTTLEVDRDIVLDHGLTDDVYEWDPLLNAMSIQWGFFVWRWDPLR